jgi:hypothetical protein
MPYAPKGSNRIKNKRKERKVKDLMLPGGSPWYSVPGPIPPPKIQMVHY